MTAYGGDLSTDRESVQARARQSLGSSGAAIYRMVAAELQDRRVTGAVLYDIGCGAGRLADYVHPFASRYVGVDLVAYEGFPPGQQFIQADLNQVPWPLPAAAADVVTSVETVEHLENPRLHVRQLARLVRPGGLVIVTTPNNLSWLSILTLIRRGVFNAFQDSCYPAHITALVETDLLRIAQEVGLHDMRLRYSNEGRIPLTARHWPRVFKGRRFSDNLLLSAVRPTINPAAESERR
ncbi:MAG: methyltransferase domain-containing protein [Phycisphaerae bacterium]|nr:methyltransferase domain-containing protein [Phycisphaerae bacterium]MDW8261197.1 methyltransferase domain-containing protein [Phycisphaerales bacterium]